MISHSITDDIDAIYTFASLSNVLSHLRLTCISFTVGQLITFSVKLYYNYSGVSYYIWGWFLLHLWLELHLELIFITFLVGITFSVVITFSGDTHILCSSLVGERKLEVGQDSGVLQIEYLRLFLCYAFWHDGGAFCVAVICPYVGCVPFLTVVWYPKIWW